MAVFFRFGIAVDRIAVSSRVEDDKVFYFGIQTGQAESFVREQSGLQCKVTSGRFTPERQVIGIQQKLLCMRMQIIDRFFQIDDRGAETYRPEKVWGRATAQA